MPIDDALFLTHTRGRGLVEVFLRGHLWVEQFLVALIECELKDPAVLKLDRMPFSHKIDLAQALGLVPPDEAATLRLVNKMRNNLAHDLAGEPSPEDLTRLEASLVGPHRAGFEALMSIPSARRSGPAEDPTEIVRLSSLFLAIIASVEIHRLKHIYMRDHGDKISAFKMFERLEERFPSTFRDAAKELADEVGIPDPPSLADVWHRPVDDEGADA